MSIFQHLFVPAQHSLTSSQIVVQHICDSVFKGKYQPGDKLTEQELCGDMGVSRTPVREACRILQAEGLLEYSAQKGFSIVTLSFKEMHDLWKVRIALEAFAAKEAVANITDEHVKQLNYLISYMDVLTHSDAIELNEKNRDFHWTIVMSSGNQFLFRYYQRAWLQTTTLVGKLHLIETQPRNCNEEHKMIVKSILDKDAEMLERLVVSHLEDAWAVLEKIMNSENK